MTTINDLIAATVAATNDDEPATLSRRANDKMTPVTEEEFFAACPGRDIFYLTLEPGQPDTIRDHVAGGSQNNPMDFDGGLYARRVEGDRYLCSIGPHYPLRFLHLPLPAVAAEPPQLQESVRGPLLAGP